VRAVDLPTSPFCQPHPHLCHSSPDHYIHGATKPPIHTHSMSSAPHTHMQTGRAPRGTWAQIPPFKPRTLTFTTVNYRSCKNIGQTTKAVNVTTYRSPQTAPGGPPKSKPHIISHLSLLLKMTHLPQGSFLWPRSLHRPGLGTEVHCCSWWDSRDAVPRLKKLPQAY
jgi:hypothetical protein